MGKQINISGESGLAFGPHLHLGVKPLQPETDSDFGGFVDPTPYFAQNEQKPQLIPTDRPNCGKRNYP